MAIGTCCPYDVTIRFLDDLAVGMSASSTTVVTDTNIIHFSEISGDDNPIHLDQDYAETTRFKGRIAHGMLIASYLSAILATKLPGPGAIYLSQSLQFKAPVRPGDTVTAKVTLTGLDPARNRAVLQTQCLVGQRLVIDGEAVVLLASRHRGAATAHRQTSTGHSHSTPLERFER